MLLDIIPILYLANIHVRMSTMACNESASGGASLFGAFYCGERGTGISKNPIWLFTFLNKIKAELF